jgi:hypothetical protein
MLFNNLYLDKCDFINYHGGSKCTIYTGNLLCLKRFSINEIDISKKATEWITHFLKKSDENVRELCVSAVGPWVFLTYYSVAPSFTYFLPLEPILPFLIFVAFITLHVWECEFFSLLRSFKFPYLKDPSHISLWKTLHYLFESYLNFHFFNDSSYQNFS